MGREEARIEYRFVPQRRLSPADYCSIDPSRFILISGHCDSPCVQSGDSLSPYGGRIDSGVYEVSNTDSFDFRVF